jgi:hypothetical protein
MQPEGQTPDPERLSLSAVTVHAVFLRACIRASFPRESPMWWVVVQLHHYHAVENV